MKEEEMEKGDCGPPTAKVFFEILQDLNQAVPNQITVCATERKSSRSGTLYIVY